MAGNCGKSFLVKFAEKQLESIRAKDLIQEILFMHHFQRPLDGHGPQVFTCCPISPARLIISSTYSDSQTIKAY